MTNTVMWMSKGNLYEKSESGVNIMIHAAQLTLKKVMEERDYLLKDRNEAKELLQTLMEEHQKILLEKTELKRELKEIKETIDGLVAYKKQEKTMRGE